MLAVSWFGVPFALPHGRSPGLIMRSFIFSVSIALVSLFF
jgi:hypothetical protein